MIVMGLGSTASSLQCATANCVGFLGVILGPVIIEEVEQGVAGLVDLNAINCWVGVMSVIGVPAAVPKGVFAVGIAPSVKKAGIDRAVGAVEVESPHGGLSYVLDAESLADFVHVEGGEGTVGLLVNNSQRHCAFDFDGLHKFRALHLEGDCVRVVVGCEGVSGICCDVGKHQTGLGGYDAVTVSLDKIIVEVDNQALAWIRRSLGLNRLGVVIDKEVVVHS